MQIDSISGIKLRLKKGFGLSQAINLAITCFFYLTFLSIWIDEGYYSYGSVINSVIGAIIIGVLFLHLLILLCTDRTTLRLPYSIELKKWPLTAAIYFFAVLLVTTYSFQKTDEKPLSLDRVETAVKKPEQTPINFYVSCREGAFLYSKPDNYSPILTLIPPDKEVLLLQPSNHDDFNVLSSIGDTLKVFNGRFKGYYFFKVRYEAKTGYVINQLLTQRGAD